MKIGSCLLPVFLVALALIGCRTPPASLPELGVSANGREGEGHGPLSPAEVSQARQLYLNKCARCHKFYSPALYSEAEWPVWMHKMSRKAKLDPAQEELLSKYLDGFRAPRQQSP